MDKTTNSKQVVIVSIILIVLAWNRILVSAFHLSPFRFHSLPLGSSSRNSVHLLNIVGDNSKDHDIVEAGSVYRYSIFLADSREKVFAIKQYRFGGPNVDEYMQSNPGLNSRSDALRSLTPTCDDRGIQKVFYRDGVFGESIQFFAQADDISAFPPTAVRDDGDIKLSLAQTYGVLGSVEAVREYLREGDDIKKVSIELKNLSVHTNARRRGIGNALTEAVKEYACSQVSILEQEEGKRYIGIVHLTVESDNKGAMRLYNEAGFEGVEEDELCTFSWSTEGENSSR